MTKIIHPGYYFIFRRKPYSWVCFYSKVFYNPKGKDTGFEETLTRYGLTKEHVFLELFKINAGKLGYYIANVRNRKYYYCGTEKIDIKVKFLSLGIGRISLQ